MALTTLRAAYADNSKVEVHALVQGLLPAPVVAQIESLLAQYGGTFDDTVERLRSRPRLNAAQQRILDVLKAADGPMTSLELSAQTGIVRGSLRPYLSRLVEGGYLYRLPGTYGPARFEAIKS